MFVTAIAIVAVTLLVPEASGCIEPMCMNGCSRELGSDGCPHCVCQPTCETMNCESTEVCILQEVQCFVAPCDLVPECRPKSEVCPVYKLTADCYLKQVAGQCDEVVCPCEMNPCSSTEICTLQTVQCFAPPCYPVAECRPKSDVCPVYRLTADCYLKEVAGQCDEVVCPCETQRCSSTEACTLQTVQCFAAPCYPVAECKPKSEVCPMYKLKADCYMKEVAGHCDKVVCPCETKSCPRNKTCVLKYPTNCRGKRCHPKARCIFKKDN